MQNLGKIIAIALSILAFYGCSNTSSPKDNAIYVNYDSITKQYYYCFGDKCQQPTKLQAFDPDDLKPLEPDYVPPVIVNNTKARVKPKKVHRHKKHHRHRKHRRKKHKTSYVCKPVS